MDIPSITQRPSLSDWERLGYLFQTAQLDLPFERVLRSVPTQRAPRRQPLAHRFPIRKLSPALAGAASPSSRSARSLTRLRREGLYSSHLTTWKRQRMQGSIDALTPKKRGPKVVVNPLVKQNREQEAVIARLTKKLKNAELIIEVQKKWLVRRDKTGMG